MPWVSQYLVMKRVSIEPNFHSLYSNFLDTLKNPEFVKMVLNETYRNIKVNSRIYEDLDFHLNLLLVGNMLLAFISVWKHCVFNSRFSFFFLGSVDLRQGSCKLL